MNTCAECIHAEMCRWMDEVERDGCDFFDGDPWIPVSERLPEGNEKVLVCGVEAINNSHVYAVKNWDVDTWRPLSAPSCKWLAWMPLPEPYRAEQEPTDWHGKYSDDEQAYKAFAKEYINRSQESEVRNDLR